MSISYIQNLPNDALDLVLGLAEHDPIQEPVCKLWYARAFEQKKLRLSAEARGLMRIAQAALGLGTTLVPPYNLIEMQISALDKAEKKYLLQIHEKTMQTLHQLYPFTKLVQSNFFENAEVVLREFSEPKNKFMNEAKMFWEACNETLIELAGDDLSLLFWIQQGQYKLVLKLLPHLPRYALNVPYRLEALSHEPNPFYNTDRANIINLIVGYLATKEEWYTLFLLVASEIKKACQENLEFTNDQLIETNNKSAISSKFASSICDFSTKIKELMQKSAPSVQSDLLLGIMHTVITDENAGELEYIIKNQPDGEEKQFLLRFVAHS